MQWSVVGCQLKEVSMDQKSLLTDNGHEKNTPKVTISLTQYFIYRIINTRIYEV